jgi:hypothetical protein
MAAAGAGLLCWVGAKLPATGLQAPDDLARRLRAHLGPGRCEQLLAAFSQQWHPLTQGSHLAPAVVLELMHRGDLAQHRVVHIDGIGLSHTQVSLALQAV